MLATSLTAAVIGVEAHLVRVEADAASGFPRFTIIGLPDSAVRESEGRIRAALRNCGYEFKWDRRITVSLAPASLRKAGSSFDLATAIGLLAADGSVPSAPLADVLLVGELALDGAVRGVAGVLPMVLAARRQGLKAAIVPGANALEAALVPEIDVYAVDSLLEAVELAARPDRPPPTRRPGPPAAATSVPDLAEVRGQLLARRALEIGAAGGHNLLLLGPPGSGKTMLAQRLPGLLPAPNLAETLEILSIHSAWGDRCEALIGRRPFRSPHHTTSDIALVGGGASPRPGEISLAHNGVLFLDELPEFRRSVLETLRQPIEEGWVSVVRVRGVLRLPARFQLVAAMNPCPCGYRGSLARGCACTPRQVWAYQSRISGPLLDRIDLHVEVPALAHDDLAGPAGEPSARVAARVGEARRMQGARFGDAAMTNAHADSTELRRSARLDPDGARVLTTACRRWALSGRAQDRLLRVARSVADLAGEPSVGGIHVAEALQYRRCTLDTPMVGPFQEFGVTG